MSHSARGYQPLGPESAGKPPVGGTALVIPAKARHLTRDSSWRRVQQAATKNRERLRRAMLMVIREARLEFDFAAFLKAYESGNAHTVMLALLPVVEAMSGAIRRTAATILFDTLVAGAESAISANGRLLLLRKRQERLGFAFDKTNPAAQAWARRESAKLVKDVTEETRAALRGIVERSFAEGIPPRTAARLIQPMIGLRQDQANRIFDKFEAVRREDGEEVALNAVRDLQDTYAKQRALATARTEVLSAANEGQRELWEQAQAEGLIAPDAEREWIYSQTGAKECPVCGPLDGERAAINGQFVHPETGETFEGPPAHTNCQCAQGIAA